MAQAGEVFAPIPKLSCARGHQWIVKGFLESGDEIAVCSRCKVIRYIADDDTAEVILEKLDAEWEDFPVAEDDEP